MRLPKSNYKTIESITFRPESRSTQQTKRLFQASVNPFYGPERKVADHPTEEMVMECHQMLALHSRIMQQP